MPKPLSNTTKRLAQAAVLTLAITSVSAPALALTHTSLFTIDVQEPADPCLAFTDFGASWSPDSFVTLTDANDNANTNIGQLTVEPGDVVQMDVSLNYTDGETCGVSAPPSGEVTATWTMPASGDVVLDSDTVTCAVSSPCSAATTGSIYAAASVAIGATPGLNSGEVFIEWVPAD